MKAPITLLEVAAAAGVSKSTVANVFSRPERVRPELRSRIEAVARELGYAGPDPKGRMLSSGKVNAIGLVAPGQGFSWVFADSFMQVFMAALAHACEDRGIGLTLLDGHGDRGLENIRRAVVDGLVLFTMEQALAIEPGLRRKLPIVVMDAVDAPDVSSVAIDNRAAGRDLARHLLQLGHRRFVVCTLTRDAIGPILHPASQEARPLVSSHPGDVERLAGVGDALAEAGLSLATMPIVEAWGTEWETRNFQSAGAMILDAAGDATAIIALGGTIALATLAEARRRGIDVPGALSIASFDDPPEAALTDPPLTALALPVAETARAAARLLFVDGPKDHIVLPVTLAVRGSTAPPRA